MNQIPYRTNNWLWGIASGCIFLALGFADPVSGAAKGDCSLWSHVGVLIRRDYFCSSAEILAHVAFLAMFLAVPAALLGWVVQALIIVLWRFTRNVQRYSGAMSPSNRNLG